MKALLLVCTLFFFSCRESAQKNNHAPDDQEAKGVVNGDTGKQEAVFHADDFKIMPGQVGMIKIGMTVKEAEEKLTGFPHRMQDAFAYGVDGGGEAYVYYTGNEPLLAFIPRMNQDTIIFIMALHKDLQTVNGLHPDSPVSELMKKYPDMKIARALMNGGEIFVDRQNNWDFIFNTRDSTRIGDYKNPADEVVPRRLDTRTSRIVVW